MRMLRDEEAVGMVRASRLVERVERIGDGVVMLAEARLSVPARWRPLLEEEWNGEGGGEWRMGMKGRRWRGGERADGDGMGGEGEGRQRQRRVICSDELEAPGWLRRQRSVGWVGRASDCNATG
jgi:hypothetical protein